VVNPATSPALTRSVDDPGRIAYQSTAACVLDTDACAFDFPAVPQNHRLVVQHVSGLLLGNVTRALAILIGGANGAFPLLSLLPHTRVRASLISRFCNISMPVCALPDRRRRRHSDLVFERDNIRIFARLRDDALRSDRPLTASRDQAKGTGRRTLSAPALRERGLTSFVELSPRSFLRFPEQHS